MYHFHSPFMLNLNLDQDVKGPSECWFGPFRHKGNGWIPQMLLHMFIYFHEVENSFTISSLELPGDPDLYSHRLLRIYFDLYIFWYFKLSGFKTKLIIILTKEPFISCWYDFSFNNNCDTTRWYVIIIYNYRFCARFFNKRLTILISINHSRLIVKLTLW